MGDVDRPCRVHDIRRCTICLPEHDDSMALPTLILATFGAAVTWLVDGRTQDVAATVTLLMVALFVATHYGSAPRR